ncbi:endonuclease/exonuclease/phosphatase family protein, partial [Treponema sp. R6D11]
MKILRRAFLLFILAVLLAAGCSAQDSKAEKPTLSAEPGTLTLMTWNVQNLFDGVDNGNEYDEFLNSAGWSTEKYKGKVNTISTAIASLNPPPDIIMFQEIESLVTIHDVGEALPGGYAYSHFAKNPSASLGVGIISRFPLAEPKAHSITIGDETTPRPVLEVRIQTEKEFVVFVCHWKSKLGGDDNTESVRRASARVILRRIRELWEEEPDIGIIVAGDLNENHNEFYRQGAQAITALLPDDPYCAQMAAGAQKDFIVLGKDKPPVPVNFPQGTIVLFSAWVRDVEKGSYYYKNNWETIDHFLVSKQFFINA